MAQPPPDSPSTGIATARPWLAPTIIVIGVWLILWVAFTVPPIVAGTLDPLEAVRRMLPLWATWILFSPITVLVSFRLPLDRQRWFPNVLFHALACALAIALSHALVPRLAGVYGHPSLAGVRPWDATPTERPDGTSDLPDNQAPQPPGPLPTARPAPWFGATPRWRPGRGGPPGARMAFDFLVYWSIVSVCQAVTWSRRAREREIHALATESHLAQARLQALQMQLNPHFLFNTLNAIATLVHTHPQSADNMLADLSTLLRAALDSTGEPEVALHRELEFLQHYLAIEQARFGSRLHIERAVDADTLDALVPTFILQPLVENAIRHGIETRSATGTIRIRARRAGEILQLEVSDTGPGPKALLETRPDRGIGLANTRARLEQLHGQHHVFTLGHAPSGGCLVTISIPFRVPPTAAASPAS